MEENTFVKEEMTKLISDENDFSDLFVLYGEINKSIIVSAISIIENKLKAINYSRSIVSRTKLVSIEILDNILKHQCKTKYKPFFQVLINKETVKIVSGNCVEDENYLVLKKYLNKLTHLNSSEIQSVYMKKLSENELDLNGNAGLGLLSILKRHDLKFTFNISSLPNNLYYYENKTLLLNID